MTWAVEQTVTGMIGCRLSYARSEEGPGGTPRPRFAGALPREAARRCKTGAPRPLGGAEAQRGGLIPCCVRVAHTAEGRRRART